MNNQKLAVEVLKVTGWHPDIRKQVGYRGDNQFICDWRVVGAVMEKCLRIVIHRMGDGWTVTAINDRDEGTTVFNKSLPRAINEAGVEALKT